MRLCANEPASQISKYPWSNCFDRKYLNIPVSATSSNFNSDWEAGISRYLRILQDIFGQISGTVSHNFLLTQNTEISIFTPWLFNMTLRSRREVDQTNLIRFLPCSCRRLSGWWAHRAYSRPTARGTPGRAPAVCSKPWRRRCRWISCPRPRR